MEDEKEQKGIQEIKEVRKIKTITSSVERVDLPQPLVPQRRTVIDSFRSRILRKDERI